MRRRPWPLVLITFFFALSPLVSLIFSAKMQGFSLIIFIKVIALTKPLEASIVYLVMPIVSVISLWSFKRWSYWSFSLISVLFVAQSISAITTSELTGLTQFAPYLALGVNLLIMSYFFLPGVRSFYKRSDLHWWKAHRRYQFDAAAKLGNKKVTILDISSGGVSVGSTEKFKSGEVLKFEYENCKLEIATAVVYENENKLGLAFQDLTEQSSKDLKIILNDLKAKKARVVNSPKSLKDDFGGWMKDVYKDPRELLVKAKK